MDCYNSELKHFRHLVRLLRQGNDLSQGLYLHKTAQCRKMQTYIHASSEIASHSPNVRPVKTNALDCTITVIGTLLIYLDPF
jgi:hypothetical protein